MWRAFPTTQERLDGREAAEVIAIIIVLGLVLLRLLSLGDAVGASALGFVLVILGWVLWRDKGEREP